ncbi:MAG TPA: hypothetical protein VFZ68_15150 [Acidimicrobiales bacterium]
MPHRPAALALAIWTLLVWATRIANIWDDAALDTGEKLGRTGLAASFTVLAAAVLVALWRRTDRWARPAVGTLAAWTTVVWVVRDVRIVAADHDLGFTLVHVVLGVASVALAALAWREASRARRVARDGRRTQPGVPVRAR